MFHLRHTHRIPWWRSPPIPGMLHCSIVFMQDQDPKSRVRVREDAICRLHEPTIQRIVIGLLEVSAAHVSGGYGVFFVLK